MNRKKLVQKRTKLKGRLSDSATDCAGVGNCSNFAYFHRKKYAKKASFLPVYSLSKKLKHCFNYWGFFDKKQGYFSHFSKGLYK